MTAQTDIADPVERAARIIAAHAQPYTEWDDLTDEWQEKTRACARAVLDDLAAQGWTRLDLDLDQDATEPAGIDHPRAACPYPAGCTGCVPEVYDVIRCEGCVIRCEGCGRTTTDPDLWDPEVDTGRVFCDACWPTRNVRVGL